MFDAPSSPELPPGFEPTELPGMDESAAASALDEPEPVAAELEAEADHDDVVTEGEESLARVVTPDFGGDRHDVTAEADDHETPDDDETYDPYDGYDTSDESDESQEHEAYDEPAAVAEESEEQADELEPLVAEAEAPVDEPERLSPWAARAQSWVAETPAEESVAGDVAEAAPEPAYGAPETVVARADEPVAEEHDDVAEAPVRLQIRRPLSATPASSALEGEFVAEHDDSEASTIFGQLRSNWLSDDESDEEQAWSANEVDRGWNAAERAEGADADDTTRAGLPVRRPGGRLLPGGVSQEPSKVVRDPEAIRNRLAAHAAGVSRGRAAAAAEPITDDYAHEETGPA
jgi:hypothetical protein